MDKALSLVGPIITAYKAAEQSGANALEHALECGKHLKTAFEAVGKRKWKGWCEEHLALGREVSEETERLYRRLAVAVDKKGDVFAKCKSIRDAMKELAKYDLKSETLVLKPERKHTPRQTHNGNTVTGLVPPEADTPPSGLKAELDNAAADDIIASIDEDMIVDLTKQSVTKLGPEKVCAALIDAWTADQLNDLVKRVMAHLSTRPRDLHRQPLAQPAL
jgi:hypothetical protein